MFSTFVTLRNSAHICWKTPKVVLNVSHCIWCDVLQRMLQTILVNCISLHVREFYVIKQYMQLSVLHISLV